MDCSQCDTCWYYDYDEEYEKNKPYKYVTPEKITLKNIKALSGKEVKIAARPEEYEDSAIIYE